jgi:hypothetical protein
MQTLFVHSAVWRGVSLFAGMLIGKVLVERPSAAANQGSDLVSWCSEARSRREDELARIRRK